jgi:hypothetical protein
MIKKQVSRSILLILLLLCTIQPSKAQHKNNFEAGLYNVGFGSIIGGIGAVINKKPSEKFVKVLLKGMGQGALGGYLLFESKRMVGKFGSTGNYSYVWPSKIVNAAGISIIENAASNRNLWEQWHLNIGFNRVDFYTKDKFKVSYRVMPFALGSTIRGFIKGRFSLEESFKIGTFVFRTDKINADNVDFIPEGETLVNTIFVTNKNWDNKENILAHELIHVYQYESFSGVNSFSIKPLQKINAKSKWIKTYNKIFYTDLNYLYFRGLYSLYNTYNSNFFEKEAYWYQYLYKPTQ